MVNPIHFQTLADKVGVAMDLSELTLQVYFSSIPKQIVKEAAIHYCKFINEFFQDEFISLWKFDGYKRKKLFSPTTEKLSEIIFSDPYSPDLVMNAYVRTESMHSKKQFQAFDRYLVYCPSAQIQPLDCSLDYLPYFKENILPVIKDNEALKQAIVDLFRLEGKRPLAPYLGHDAGGYFYSAPEKIGSPLCHGHIIFRVPTGCLGTEITKAAELFAAELKALCSLLDFAGGTVGIEPNASEPHMLYFRNADECDLDQDCPEDCSSNYWNKIAFACGCEWVNVLSPIARKKLFPKDIPTVSESGLIVKELPNHGIYAQIDKEPETVDVNDLLYVKKFLYPALYPGKNSWELKTTFFDSDGKLVLYNSPRNWWERVPVFPEEITVQNGVITFEYKKGLFGSGPQWNL